MFAKWKNVAAETVNNECALSSNKNLNRLKISRWDNIVVTGGLMENTQSLSVKSFAVGRVSRSRYSSAPENLDF